MGCCLVSSSFITIRLRAVPFIITIVQCKPQRQTMMTTKKKNSITNYRMSLIRHRRRTFFLCKETGMQNWVRMLVETGKVFVDPSAVVTQMRKDSDFWSMPPLTILCWQPLLVFTKHPEDGLGIAQMTTPQPDWFHLSEEALPIRSEHCQNTKFSRSRHWKWSRLADDLPPSPEKNQQAKHTRLKFDL